MHIRSLRCACEFWNVGYCKSCLQSMRRGEMPTTYDPVR